MNTKPDDDDFDDDFLNDPFLDDDARDAIKAGYGFHFKMPIPDDLAELMISAFSAVERAIQEGKPIDVNLSLKSALGKLPPQWLDAICEANQLTLPDKQRENQRAKVAALVARLTSRDELRCRIAELSPCARIALRRILDNGGWMRLANLTRDFGSMDGDDWFWSKKPPTSCLGELRYRGMLFVGRTARTKEGKLGKRMVTVAVVPKDIRSLLIELLSEVPNDVEDEAALKQRPAVSEDKLKTVLSVARGYYDELGWQPPLTYSDVEDFLRYVNEQGDRPDGAWFQIEILITFIEARWHEIRSLDDLCGYHISELASSFLDASYGGRLWTLRMRRSLIEALDRLYDRLYQRGRICAETREEIHAACMHLTSGKRRLDLIRRPPPLGGELVFIYANPDTGAEEHYTINHRRLLMVWFWEFHRDWQALLNACDVVPSGVQKKALVQELMGLDPDVCDLILSQAYEEDRDRATRWFYEERLLELSMW